MLDKEYKINIAPRILELLDPSLYKEHYHCSGLSASLSAVHTVEMTLIWHTVSMPLVNSQKMTTFAILSVNPSTSKSLNARLNSTTTVGRRNNVVNFFSCIKLKPNLVKI